MAAAKELVRTPSLYRKSLYSNFPPLSTNGHVAFRIPSSCEEYIFWVSVKCQENSSQKRIQQQVLCHNISLFGSKWTLNVWVSPQKTYGVLGIRELWVMGSNSLQTNSEDQKTYGVLGVMGYEVYIPNLTFHHTHLKGSQCYQLVPNHDT